MPPEILQVVTPTIKWSEFISGGVEAFGRSITASLDAKRVPVGNYGSFIGALAEMRCPDSDPDTAVRDMPLLRQHLWFSLLVVCSHECYDEIRESWTNGVSFLEAKDKMPHKAFLMSGTVMAWMLSCKEYLKAQWSRDTRILFGKVYLALVAQGFGIGFPGKVGLPDGTFILEGAFP